VLRLPPHGGAAAYTTAQGLTSDQTHALAQDREGNVWIGTELGLDRLRPARVVAEPGIPANSPTSYRMAAARDGTVYVADAAALYAIRPHQPPAACAPCPAPPRRCAPIMRAACG
jgi:ligand-binding sensor domain-containing protein